MPGRRQKAIETLQGHRSKPAAMTLMPAGEVKRIIPTMPKGLHPVAKRAWKAFWASPLAQTVDLAADEEAIRRWAYCLSERELLEEEIREHPTVPGSMGQMVANPLMGLLKERTREIEKFREQFGMNPLARMRLGIAYSDADEALDRMQKRRQTLEPAIIEVVDERDARTS